MQTLTVGQVKSQFSDVLAKVAQGKSFAITYGKNKKKVAAVVPFEPRIHGKTVTLGLLEGKASFKMYSDFSITDEALMCA